MTYQVQFLRGLLAHGFLEIAMTEIPRFWRTTHQRMRLEGDYDPETNSVAFPPGLNRPRFVLNGNGHHPEVEKPLEAGIVYQAQTEDSLVTNT